MTIKMLRALVLCSLSSAVCSFAAVDSGLLGLVPQNSEFVIGINVAASRNSDFGQYLTAKLSADAKGFEQLETVTGFDPRRDLESVIFAGVGGSTGRQNVHGVLLARGTFDQNKIRSAALAKGAVVQNVSGVDFYLPANTHGKNAFAFLDTNVFATGSLTELQQAVANRSNPAPLDPKLQELITQAGADNDIWFASTVPVSRFAAHLQTELGQSCGHRLSDDPSHILGQWWSEIWPGRPTHGRCRSAIRKRRFVPCRCDSVRYKHAPDAGPIEPAECIACLGSQPNAGISDRTGCTPIGLRAGNDGRAASGRPFPKAFDPLSESVLVSWVFFTFAEPPY